MSDSLEHAQHNALASFRMRKGDDRQPTKLGWYLLAHMATAGLNRASLARIAGVSGSTVSRIIYGDTDPDDDTLAALATALARPYDEIMAEAGRRIPAATPRQLDPLAVDLDAVLTPGPLVTGDERDYVRRVVEQTIDPLRKRMLGKSA